MSFDGIEERLDRIEEAVDNLMSEFDRLRAQCAIVSKIDDHELMARFPGASIVVNDSIPAFLFDQCGITIKPPGCPIYILAGE